ncbi:hypothetical protein FXO38_27798 [Capsicum annuum]|nr:hypothetical protein FXO38_27798 [Capsicum annuum]KAF3657412.1 hypothetical protein FXO37_14938 [Capsicum annuum]
MTLVMLRNLLFSPLRGLIHKDFHEILDKMTLNDKISFLIVHVIDKHNLWHRLPVFFGLVYLGLRRHLNQEYNLINVGRTPTGVRSNPEDYPYRTADGKYNDPFNEGAGSEFSFFGRNMMPVDQHDKVYCIIYKTTSCPSV